MQTKDQTRNKKIKPFRKNKKAKYPAISKYIQRRNVMEFLQTELFNQTKLNFISIKKTPFYKRALSALFPREKNQPPAKQLFFWIKKENTKIGSSGFITVLILPFLSLIITAIIGFAGLSLGIKNITRSQSLCIQQALKTQKALGSLLTQLLKLNKKVSYMSKARKTADASIKTAMASVVLIPKTPQLIEVRDSIKLLQKTLILKQERILSQSFLVKKQALTQLKQKFKNLKVSHVQKLDFYRKALAVKKEKIGSDAYIYKPVEDFKNHQKITFQWRLSVFHPLEKSRLLFKNHKASYSCTSSLDQRGKKWLSALYH